MSDRRNFTTEIDCGHCGNSVRMEIVSEYSQVRDHDEGGFPFAAGPVHEVLKCPACNGISLRYHHFHDHFIEDLEYEVVYPETRSGPLGLPRTIQTAYEAALKVRAIDANAYSVLLGRVLELVCDDRNASGRSLNDRLNDLASKGEIPDRLTRVAASLRQLRNVGAHASLGELTRAEIPILDDLCRALLEYVYSAPHLVKQAEQRLRRLKSRKAKKRSRKKAPKKK